MWNENLVHLLHATNLSVKDIHIMFITRSQLLTGRSYLTFNAIWMIYFVLLGINLVFGQKQIPDGPIYFRLFQRSVVYHVVCGPTAIDEKRVKSTKNKMWLFDVSDVTDILFVGEILKLPTHPHIKIKSAYV